MFYYAKKSFHESKAGEQCVAYLKSIQGKTISEKEAKAICDKYADLFYNEEGSWCQDKAEIIRNTYIIYYLFKEYNITVSKVLDSHNDMHEYKEKPMVSKKTAPTLIDGWYIYILVMLVLSIFHERVLGWIVVTIVFLLWRASEIKKYN